MSSSSSSSPSSSPPQREPSPVRWPSGRPRRVIPPRQPHPPPSSALVRCPTNEQYTAALCMRPGCIQWRADAVERKRLGKKKKEPGPYGRCAPGCVKFRKRNNREHPLGPKLKRGRPTREDVAARNRILEAIAAGRPLTPPPPPVLPSLEELAAELMPPPPAPSPPSPASSSSSSSPPAPPLETRPCVVLVERFALQEVTPMVSREEVEEADVVVPPAPSSAELVDYDDSSSDDDLLPGPSGVGRSSRIRSGSSSSSSSDNDSAHETLLPDFMDVASYPPPPSPSSPITLLDPDLVIPTESCNPSPSTPPHPMPPASPTFESLLAEQEVRLSPVIQSPPPPSKD